MAKPHRAQPEGLRNPDMGAVSGPARPGGALYKLLFLHEFFLKSRLRLSTFTALL
jgi:hypothetical protein